MEIVKATAGTFKRSKNNKHLARLPRRKERRRKLLELETKEKTLLLTLQKFKNNYKELLLTIVH